MKKWLCGWLAALMMIMAATAAFAAARMPENRGVLTDDADVLSAQSAKDIAQYAELARDETGVGLYVAMVHFLDGLDAQTYANRLFAAWNLQPNDLLLLGAAGEDSFATAMGAEVEKKLGARNAENLMYTSSSFGNLFARQQYDAAMGAYFEALNDMLVKRYDVEMELGGLFGSAKEAAQATAAPQASHGEDYSSRLWSEIMGSIRTNTDDYQAYQESREQEDNGIGAGGWIILAILAMIVFGQSDPVRKARNSGRGHYRDYGCGCSPLGWILAMIGVGGIIDRLRGRR